MKKIVTFLSMALIALSLTACSDQKSDINSSNPSLNFSSQATKIINNAQADIKFPELLTEELIASKVFQDACTMENSVIQFNGEIVTSSKSVDNFMTDVEADQNAALYVYSFRNYQEANMKIATVKVFEQSDGKLTNTILTAVDDSEDQWNTELRKFHASKALTKLEYQNQGVLYGEYEENYEPEYWQVVSNYELHENYDQMLELSQKYVNPIYMLLICNDVFDNASEIEEWMYISQDLYRAQDRKIWEEYPDDMINLADFLNIIHQYFDVEDEDVIEHLDEFLQEDGENLYYYGGVGGTYLFLVDDIVENGNLITMKVLAKSTFDFKIHEEDSFELTVETQPNGTFKYKSLEHLYTK